jgi:hypothetical protein
MNRRSALAFLAALATAAASCTILNVGHISLLRENQDRFSRLAAEENKATLLSTLPADAGRMPTNDPDGDRELLVSPSVDPARSRELHRGYRELGDSATALIGRAGGELEKDRLLGSALTLEVLAQWRAGFYAHLLRAQESSGGEAPSDPLPSSMTAVVARASTVMETVESRKIDLFPRDRFLLRAMKGLVRYDIAYVRTIADSMTGKLADKAIKKSRAQEIGVAERELVEATAKESAQIRRYAFLARLTMLRSGSILATLAFPDTERRAELKDLAEQIDLFHKTYDNDPSLQAAIKVKPDEMKKLLPPFKQN